MATYLRRGEQRPCGWLRANTNLAKGWTWKPGGSGRWKNRRQRKGRQTGSKERRPKLLTETFRSEIFVLLIIFSCAVQDALATPWRRLKDEETEWLVQQPSIPSADSLFLFVFHVNERRRTTQYSSSLRRLSVRLHRFAARQRWGESHVRNKSNREILALFVDFCSVSFLSSYCRSSFSIRTFSRNRRSRASRSSSNRWSLNSV